MPTASRNEIKKEKIGVKETEKLNLLKLLF